MKKFEYRVVDFGDIILDFNDIAILNQVGSFQPDNEHIQSLLNSLGNDGWELVATNNDRFYFKRELITDSPSSFTTKKG